MKTEKFDVRNYGIIAKAKVYYISPKKVNGAYLCDLLFLDEKNKTYFILKPDKLTHLNRKRVYELYNKKDIIGDVKKLNTKV